MMLAMTRRYDAMVVGIMNSTLVEEPCQGTIRSTFSVDLVELRVERRGTQRPFAAYCQRSPVQSL